MNALGLATVAALLASVSALGFAAVRVASLSVASGLGRLLAVVTLVGSAAVVEALALGLVGLGTSTVALLLASVAIALGASRLPAPAVSPGRELATWWGDLETPWRLGAGAAAGIWAAWGLHWLLVPALDIDTTLFHLTQPAIWVHNGHPGSIELVDLRYPVGSYPLTNEVLVSWIAGLSRNVGATLLWGPVAGALLVTASMAGMRRAGAGRTQAALAAVALLAVPTVADSITSLDSDLGSAAWATVAVALAIHAARDRSSPMLIAYAILACGLAIGSKTSVAVVCLLALGAAAYAMRERLPRPRWLLLALAGALAVGGVWYARNLISHGSPLWPFIAAPWGDPRPGTFEAYDSRFILNPISTLDGYVRTYFDAFGFAPLLLLAAVILPFAARMRRWALVGGAVAICVLVWASAPYTGSEGNPLENLQAISTLRYLMPVVALAAGVLAVLATRRDAVGRVALGTLAVAAVAGVALTVVGSNEGTEFWTLISGHEGVPPASYFVAGAALGAAAAYIACLPVVRGKPAAVVAGVLVIAAALALARYPDSFLSRYGGEPADPSQRFGDTRRTYGQLVSWFNGQADYRDGDDPVLFGAVIAGPLTGGRFEHPIGLVEPEEACEAVKARLERGWLVVPVAADAAGPPPSATCFEGTPPVTEAPLVLGETALVFRGE